MTDDTPIGITFQPDIYERVMNFIPEDRNARILDAGAGQGYLVHKLLEAGYKQVQACDFSASGFKVKDVPFAESNLNDHLPYDDGTFDCIVSLEVAEHIEHHDNYFRELLRVTRRGGLVILSTPNIQSLTSRIHFLLYGCTDAARRPFDPGPASHVQHVNHISLQQLLYYAEHHGGRIEQVFTNRTRRSSLGWLFLYPIIAGAMLLRSRRRKYKKLGYLNRQYRHLVMSPPVLLGRILFLAVRKPE